MRTLLRRKESTTKLASASSDEPSLVELLVLFTQKQAEKCQEGSILDGQRQKVHDENWKLSQND